MRDAAGRVTHVMVISTDMSQVLDIQDHLSSLGLMVGSISHDIKGLLTGMEGGMYMLDSGLTKENQEQIKEGLDVVKLMASRIKRIVLDVLFYAKERDLIKEQKSRSGSPKKYVTAEEKHNGTADTRPDIA